MKNLKNVLFAIFMISMSVNIYPYADEFVFRADVNDVYRELYVLATQCDCMNTIEGTKQLGEISERFNQIRIDSKRAGACINLKDADKREILVSVFNKNDKYKQTLESIATAKIDFSDPKKTPVCVLLRDELKKMKTEVQKQ